MKFFDQIYKISLKIKFHSNLFLNVLFLLIYFILNQNTSITGRTIGSTLSSLSWVMVAVSSKSREVMVAWKVLPPSLMDQIRVVFR